MILSLCPEPGHDVDDLPHIALADVALKHPVENSPPKSAEANAHLAEQVRRALLETGYNELQSVKVAAERGHVILYGRVSTYYIKQVAQDAGMKVDGVERVFNELRVE